MASRWTMGLLTRRILVLMPATVSALSSYSDTFSVSSMAGQHFSVEALVTETVVAV